MNAKNGKISLSVNNRIVDKNIHNDVGAFSNGWCDTELSIEEFADTINDGHAISAQFCGGIRNSANFLRAGFIAVDIDEGTSLNEAFADVFVQQYGSIIYTTPSHRKDGADRFRIIFRTPLITEAKTWSFALTGLAIHLHGDISATDGARLFYGSRGCKPIIIGRELSAESLQDLVEIGREHRKDRGLHSKSRNSNGAYRQSFEAISRTAIIKLANGEEGFLTDIAESSPVHCPVHDDSRPSAYVVRSKKGSPGVHCLKCMQTFWIEGGPKAHYDFYAFEKMVTRLAVEQAGNPESSVEYIQEDGKFPIAVEQKRVIATTLDCKFIQPVLLKDGVCLVRSPKGSGKTKAIEEIARMARIHEQSLLLIGHRRTLISELSERLALKCYLDDWDRGFQLPNEKIKRAEERLSDSRPNFYGLSVDSLPLRLPRPRPYDIIVIDECEQVLSHVCAQTLQNGPTVLKLLRHYLTTVPTLYLFDADLNNVTMGFVSQCRGEREQRGLKADMNVRYVVNLFREDGREYELFESDTDLQKDLLENAYLGKRIYVACNSKRRCEALDLWLKSKLPDARILLVTAEEKDSEAVRSFLGNVVREFLKFDIVIASPAIGTGIDITFPGSAQKIDLVYGFFNEGINSHYDIDQQLGRVRNPGKVRVWISKKEDYFETDVSAIKMEMVQTGKHDTVITGYTLSGSPEFDVNDPCLSLKAEAYAVYRASQNRLQHHFIQHKEHNGWKVKFVVDTKDNKKVAAEMGAIGDQIALRRVERVLTAKRIDQEQYGDYLDQRKAGKPVGTVATYEGIRFELERFYGREADEALIVLDNQGRYRNQVERYESLMIHQGQDELENRMCQYWATSNWKKSFPAIGHPLLDALYLSSGLIHAGKFTPRAVINAGEMEPFITLARERAKLLEMDYSIRLRRDFDAKPIQTLNEILELVGLAVELDHFRKSDGKKRYFYRLSESLLEGMTNVVRTRREAGIERANRDIEHFRLKLSRKRPTKPGPTQQSFSDIFDRG